MKNKWFSVGLAAAFLLVTAFAATPPTVSAKLIVFGGGPAGGTFQVVANAIQVYKPVKEIKGLQNQGPILRRIRGKPAQGELGQIPFRASCIPAMCIWAATE